jgi:uncharacterized protein YdeI (YjbR/CyaY-like superfamily)
MKKDHRIDAYISKSQPFARPILKHLRQLIHDTCSEAEETVKWGFPHFEYKGVLCSMASFKQHCAFGFWKASLMSDPHKIFSQGDTAMGHLGQIKSLADLPSDKILKEYIKEAVKLNQAGIKLPAKTPSAEKKLTLPGYFKKALSKSKKALKTFEGFSYSHRKEYIEWITEAKSEETRDKRLVTAIEWMAEGKSRHWKYVKK